MLLGTKSTLAATGTAVGNEDRGDIGAGAAAEDDTSYCILA